MRELRSATRGESIDDGTANLGSSSAAVLQEKDNDFSRPFQVRAIDDRPTASLSGRQAGSCQNAKMRRERVVGDGQPTSDLAGR